MRKKFDICLCIVIFFVILFVIALFAGGEELRNLVLAILILLGWLKGK